MKYHLHFHLFELYYLIVIIDLYQFFFKIQLYPNQIFPIIYEILKINIF